MSYLGNSPTDQSFVATVDYFNGDGVTVAFTLSRQVASVAQVQAVIENVPQNPSSAFTLMGNVITFTSAPPSGSANIYVYYTSPNTKVMAPSAGTVDRTALAAAAVTPVKMANGGAEFGIRNRIINGDMRIDQRNIGAAVAADTGSPFVTDRWSIRHNTGGGTFTGQQTTPLTGSSYSKALKLLVTAADSSIATTEFYVFRSKIEGFNIADLQWGTSSAKPITISFEVSASVVGTYSVSVCNYNNSRCYVVPYTIVTANTPEVKTITILGDTGGTWYNDNGIGIDLVFNIGMGPTYTTSSPNTWLNGNFYAVSGQTQLIATSGATFYITGVQLEKGTLATPFEYRPYANELALCQRYYYKIKAATNYANFGIGRAYSSSGAGINIELPVPMRAAPTGSTSSFANFNSSGTVTTPTNLDPVNQYDTNYRRMTINVVSTFVSGQAVALNAENTTSAEMSWSAEL